VKLLSGSPITCEAALLQQQSHVKLLSGSPASSAVRCAVFGAVLQINVWGSTSLEYQPAWVFTKNLGPDYPKVSRQQRQQQQQQAGVKGGDSAARSSSSSSSGATRKPSRSISNVHAAAGQ
jgi:hypothetical protein